MIGLAKSYKIYYIQKCQISTAIQITIFEQIGTV